MRCRWGVVPALLVSFACADPVESDGGVDAGPVDVVSEDAEPADAEPVDAEVTDVGVLDAGAADAAAQDALPTDVGFPDAEPADVGFPDAEPPDMGFPDAEPPDAGFPDAEPPDTGLPDAEPPDVGFLDVGFPDAAPPDTGVPDAEPVDVGFPDAGTPDSGLVDAGPQLCTVAPNSCPGQLVCLGEQCSCILQMHGDHYLRTDGTVVYWGGGAPTVITSTAGAPLSGFTQVYSGWSYGCARRDDGTVWCWPTGSLGNRSGELGNGATASSVPSSTYLRATAVLVAPGAPLTGVARINGGASRSYLASANCAVHTNGNLSCWGSPDSSGGGGGSLFNDGVGGSRPYAVPILAAPGTPLTGVRAVSLGTRHACVIRDLSTAGQVWCWGANIGGPLGQGNQTGQTYPVQVINLPAPADEIGAGADLTCARLGPTVYCWGSNNTGQVGIGPPNAVGNHDGCINFCKLTPAQVLDDTSAPLDQVVELDVGYLAVCARRADHTLWCWGRSTSSAQNDVAMPATINAVPVDNVARFTTAGSSGYRGSLRYLKRDDTLFRTSQSHTPLCP